jgi:hypothetical protein
MIVIRCWAMWFADDQHAALEIGAMPLAAQDPVPQNGAWRGLYISPKKVY